MHTYYVSHKRLTGWRQHNAFKLQSGLDYLLVYGSVSFVVDRFLLLLLLFAGVLCYVWSMIVIQYPGSFLALQSSL